MSELLPAIKAILDNLESLGWKLEGNLTLEPEPTEKPYSAKGLLSGTFKKEVKDEKSER